MRLIDGDTLYRAFEEVYNEPDCSLADAAWWFFGKLEDAPIIAPPPNGPLTLEELREMDGAPVWISPAKENGKVPARWMLVSGYNKNKDIYLFAPSCNIAQGYDGKSYGKTWLAYRRRPEEE